MNFIVIAKIGTEQIRAVVRADCKSDARYIFGQHMQPRETKIQSIKRIDGMPKKYASLPVME